MSPILYSKKMDVKPKLGKNNVEKPEALHNLHGIQAKDFQVWYPCGWLCEHDSTEVHLQVELLTANKIE